jgi:hypothetical protein
MSVEQDIFVACIDNLKGFGDAVEHLFSENRRATFA